jgi:oxygen-independent coproporphyrinogen-3 oxidase
VKPVSIYVHIPFCTVKCGYCDFNAYAGLEALKDDYRDALVAELRAVAPDIAGRTIGTVAFGGGTPGEVPASHIAGVIEAIKAAAPLAPGAEVSLEANPGTVDAAHLRDLRAAGVTRLSLGAQSFDAAELRFLDRIHSPEATAASVALARAAGFESVGLDLIYGLPAQAIASWEASLRRAIELGPDHISTYALTVEDGTPLGLRVDRGRVTPLDGDLVAEMYDAATVLLTAAGFRQYELSNWAKTGHRSRHNSVYWTDGEYLGIGAGAHGYFSGERYENIAHPRAYVEAVAAGEPGQTRPALLKAYRPDRETAIFDWVTLALRLIEGFDPAAFEQRFGVGLDDALGAPLEACEAAGLLQRDGKVRLTLRGRLLHGEVAVQILTHLRALAPAAT